MLNLLVAAALLLPVNLLAQDTSASEYKRLDTVLAVVRQRNVRNYSIATSNGIDESRFVRIGDIDQWISIRGEDRKNPVILFVHGGPGDATTLLGYAVFRSWLKRFTVVQWDQRGSGKTYGRNGPALAPTMTIPQLVRDGIELVDSLRQLLKKDRITVVCHSFGSTLGLQMVKARPDLFAAYVGTGQVATTADRELSASYAALVEEARRRGVPAALRQLLDVGPPPWKGGRGYSVVHSWANAFENADTYITETLGLMLVAPGYTIHDLNEDLAGEAFSGEHLVPQIASLTDSTFRGPYRVPVFVFQGVNDFTTPVSLAREFVSRIQAPKKRLVLISDAGHFAVFTRPEEFLRDLIVNVSPLIDKRWPKALP